VNGLPRLLLYLALAACLVLAGALAAVYGAEQQIAFGIDQVAQLSIWQVITVALVVLAGFTFGVPAATFLVAMVKHGNRAAGNQPLGWFVQIGIAVGIGFLCGAGMQLLLQRLLHWLFGVPLLWELPVFAGILTVIGNIALYHVILIYARHKDTKAWHTVYELVRCRHPDKHGAPIDESDHTRIDRVKREDDTEQRR
jgi:hypothetical protein